MKYFVGLVVSFVFLSCLNIVFSMCRCFLKVFVKIMILLIKFFMLFIFWSSFFIIWLNVVGVFIRLNGIVLNWYNLDGVEKVVSGLFLLVIGIC